ncbi:SOS response-associated peptidase [Modicisalibacter xianhensis]|uniref:Abasic site processing protein n=1 Tax=Modicisalibacter xianhensis TaxID=442341 RepID=A0A1I2ZAX3_9GAMM|nr:SOS response-associated peptidase [Halomonas xianhensis]SFH35012.1 Putative SOS response-associated peptidase YedK [Halomonas xianhensis]
MCGRFAAYDEKAYTEFLTRLGVTADDHAMVPRFNVAPGTWCQVVRRVVADTPPQVKEMWWGYRPAWGKASQPINARVETVATSGYFKSAFQKRRCLVYADGWYEWDKATTPKQPYFLCRKDRKPLLLAGIYTERDDGKLGFAIITEPARGAAREIHDRMPVLLDEERIESWLDPDLTDREVLRNVVKHLKADQITYWPVSTRINRPSQEGDESLINPA